MVSVIIPVYNDRERLRECLKTLEQQTYPSDSYEIIVVDNGSAESITDLIELFPHAVTVTEKQPGSYAARNRGLTLARGEILAFTDADCIPEVTWLEEGVRALVNDSQANLVGGKITLFFRHPPHLTPVELYERLMAFPQKQHIKKHHFTPTANLFTYRALFEDLGYFDARLKSNGDRQWCQRAVQKGYQIKYAESAIVRHPARYTFEEIARRYIRMAGGRVDSYRQQYRNNLLAIGKIAQEITISFLKTPKELLLVWWKSHGSIKETIQIFSVLWSLKCILNREKVRVLRGGVSRNW